MVKRPKSPEIHEEARFFTVYQPYPLHANWMMEEDQQKCAMWVAECIGVNHLWAIHYRPKARGMILLEVSKHFIDHGRLLGEHRWSEVLKSPDELESTSVTQVFHSFYTKGRDAQKDGWKAISVPNTWFKEWAPGKGDITRPYPPTHWCSVPVEDRTNKPICRPLPSEQKPPPAQPRSKGQVVGSSKWVEKQFDAPPVRSSNSWSKPIPFLDTAKANAQNSTRNASPSVSTAPLSSAPATGNATKPSTPFTGAQSPLPPTMPLASKNTRAKPISLNEFISGPQKPKKAWHKPLGSDKKISFRDTEPKPPVNAWVKKPNIQPSEKTISRPSPSGYDQDMDYSGWDLPDPAPTSSVVSASVSNSGSAVTSPAPIETRLQPDQPLSGSIHHTRPGSDSNNNNNKTNNTNDRDTHNQKNKRRNRGKGKQNRDDKDKERENNEKAWKAYTRDFSSNAVDRNSEKAEFKAKEKGTFVPPPPDPSNPGMLTPGEMKRAHDRNTRLRPWERDNIESNKDKLSNGGEPDKAGNVTSYCEWADYPSDDSFEGPEGVEIPRAPAYEREEKGGYEDFDKGNSTGPLQFGPSETKKVVKYDWAGIPVNDEEEEMAAWGLTAEDLPSPSEKEEEVKSNMVMSPIEDEIEDDLDQIAEELRQIDEKKVEYDWAGNPIVDDPAEWGVDPGELLQQSDEKKVEYDWAGNPIVPDASAWGIDPNDNPDNSVSVWDAADELAASNVSKEKELICPTHQIACKKGICRDMAKLLREQNMKQREQARSKDKGPKGPTRRGSASHGPGGTDDAKEAQEKVAVTHKKRRRTRKTDPTHTLRSVPTGTMRGFATNDRRNAKALKNAKDDSAGSQSGDSD